MQTLKRFFITFAAVLWFVSPTRVAAEDELSFNQDIRPILSQNCFACHGPDEGGREAGLRLDIRDEAIDHGAITPGDAASSSMLERIESDDDDMLMPPPHTGKKLSAQQVVLLKRWIEQDAAYESHWSFQSVPATVAPPSAGSLTDWATTELDQFVAARFLQRDLQPAEVASRPQWLRRVTFDLIGLPPSIEDLDNFLADKSPDAYERVVDRLLADSNYGQRMANMWLDVARYADTFGYQNDIEMEVWPWRDWVINAFNQNMRYDEFVRLQTAGDLVSGSSTSDRLATTFNRLHRQTNEGGSIPEEFRVANIVDRTSTNATAFLGLTFQCARCHDHKYDPILQKDFYQLSAYFANIDELGLYSHFTRAVPTPAMLLYEGDQEERHVDAIQQMNRLETQLADLVQNRMDSYAANPDLLISKLPPPPVADWHITLDAANSTDTARTDDLPSIDGVVDTAVVSDGDQTIDAKGVPEFGRYDPFSFGIWVKPSVNQSRMVVVHQSVAAEDSGFRGFQLTLENGHPQFSLIHFWPGNAIRVQSDHAIPLGEWSHVAVTYDASSTASGVQLFVDGVSQSLETLRNDLNRDIKHVGKWGDLKVGDVVMQMGARFRDIGFRDGGLDDLQVFRRRLSDAEVAAMVLQARPDLRIELTTEMKLDHELTAQDPDVRQAIEALLVARRRENEIVTDVREIMTMREATEPVKNYVLNRGEYDDRGEEITAGTPSFLDGLENVGDDATGNRLELARWMTDRSNPLTARVMVNRMWYLFFGRGIVATLEDFGSQGSPPSHPMLLDYLARSLMDDNWDLKNLCRRIVLSQTYRQSSQPNDASEFASDPQNVWLARGPKHRLSAEQVRDAALFASGLLVDKIGGPSVMPYQPEGLWEESGTGKHYHQSSGDGLYRRSLYTFWRRTSPPPSMLTFDATSRESCTPKRELTTTPLQALVLLNDPQYVEASRTLAETLIRNHGENVADRWTELFRRLISHSPSDAERKVIDQLYREQLAYFANDPSAATEFLNVGQRHRDETLDAVDAAATGVVVETMFSYDETMMKR